MVWLIVAGLVAGMLSGMGMGGGTVYIPILTEVFGVPQHMAQWLNLVAFIPAAMLSLLIHRHNGLLDSRSLWTVLIPAVAGCVMFALLAVKMQGNVLRIVFAFFLLAVGTAGLVCTAVGWWRHHRSNTPREPDDC